MVRFIVLAGLTTALWGTSLEGSFVFNGADHKPLVQVQFGSSAQAQSAINVRTGEHDEYSRLVFDGVASGSYSVDKTSNGKVIISFKGSGGIAGQASEIDALRNVSGLQILSEAPLKLSVNIPEDSRIRDFSIGDRLIFDIYNSPSSAKPQAQSSSLPDKIASEDAPETQAARVPSSQVRKKPDRAEELEKLPKPTEPIKGADKAQDEAGRAEIKAAEPVKPVDIEVPLKIEADSKDPNYNLMALSDTTAFGMAAYEHRGEMVFVNDSQNFPVVPQVKGPQEKQINPLEKITVEGASAFKTKDMEGFSIEPTGGGLLWRLAITDTPKERSHVHEERIAGVGDDLRGGKVVWPFDTARKVFRVFDEYSGLELFVVTVDDSGQFAGPGKDFVDFEQLNSPVGLAILPKVDDLEVIVNENGEVEVSRPGGLAVISQDVVDELEARIVKKQKYEISNTDWTIAYNFKDWEFGNIKNINETRNLILGSFAGVKDPRAVEAYIKLARMYIANGMGSEALGFLNLASTQLPGIEDNIDYKALKAGAEVLAGRPKDAFFSLSDKDLDAFEEVGYWKAAALAELGDWNQAYEVMPQDFKVLFNYPDNVFHPIALDLAEVALRAGETKLADEILAAIRDRRESMFDHQEAKLTYLTGESFRQKGEYNKTIRTWNRLVKGSDDLFRTRAILALTRLNAERGKMDLEGQINNLERLRYAWRGDELEAQVNYWLGKAYFEDDKYARGLNILREATTYADGANLSERIASEMRDLYAELFLTDKINELTPLDAAALYEQFTELAPTGEDGDRLVERLAERLQKADLLDRASSLLEKQLEFRLQGIDAYRVAVRLTLLKLIDEKPVEALRFLDKAEEVYKTLPEELQTPERSLELVSLRARGEAFRGRPDLALQLLEKEESHPELNKLAADIAWNAKYWDDAAYALEQVIIDRDVSLTRPLETEDATLILNRAVALNLATDRVALANMREKYTDAMNQTDRGKIFEVVTRPRQSVSLADKETLMSVVAETDLFADFLENYSDFKNTAANTDPVPTGEGGSGDSSEAPESEDAQAFDQG